jgi:prophage DNA circulation protein
MALFGGGLIPASYRGAPFAVLADEVGGGRRQAVHRYPGRDEPWAEDMGRAERRYRFRGFIVDNDVVFAGGPIQLQRTLLLAALEAKGSGLLTHPTLGAINASVTHFAVGQDQGAQTMSSLDIEFVESGKKTFPSLLSSSSGLLSAANLVKVGLVVDGVRAIAEASANGGRRFDLQVATASWTTRSIALGADATALYGLAALLPGSFGRFAAGANAGAYGVAESPFASDTTVDDLVGRASLLRSSISAAAQAAGDAADTADLRYAASVGATAVSLVEALGSACSDPADAIRLLGRLALFDPLRPEAATPMGVAYGNMVRRAAAAELVNASARYQPGSADEMISLVALLAPLMADIAETAADAGDDESFFALRGARAAVVRDLRARGATLASLRQWRMPTTLPSLALAQRCYRDPGRADQLTAQARPVHPLFMPSTFEALAA